VTYRLEQCGEDYEEVIKKLHAKEFTVAWPGRGNQYWIAYDDETQAIVGFCSAEYQADLKLVELTRAVVSRKARGSGLQRRMIKVRLAWGMKQGAVIAVTYTSLRNYPSMVSLLKEGFNFYRRVPRAWREFHWMYKILRDGRRAAQLKKAFASMA
jgi:RimJ/RimL family protein N-acetyltransferase